MLRYRSASFFIKTYAPEIANGMQTTEELIDSNDVYNIQEQDVKEEIDEKGNKILFDEKSGEIIEEAKEVKETENNNELPDELK